ncbi:unnamed protein product [Schistocephalus solidus]|uniref:Trafficking protein particle complex subunit 13 N-terminal domain-containing protein n=1 Tax=Schistocephalus solidus TaxID=70667 RepID=A0A3P7EV31_SCHSO|nr:unnamed protein product [Schistocephalus solidus]
MVFQVTIQNRSDFIQLATRGFSGGQLAALGSNTASVDPQKITLKPHESLNAVVQHEMKDLGEHTLACSVSYVISSPSDLRLPDQPTILPRQPSLTGRPPPFSFELPRNFLLASLVEASDLTMLARIGDQSAPKDLETKHSFHKNFKFMVSLVCPSFSAACAWSPSPTSFATNVFDEK